MRFTAAFVMLAAALAVAPAQAQPAPADGAELQRRGGVLARVGEVTITVGQVEDAINEQSPFLRVRYRDRAELQQFVESMLRFELLARAAERANIDEDGAVRRRIRQDAVQQLVRRDFDETASAANVPDEDVRQYYETHPEEFNEPELRRASHIAVASREEADALLERVREMSPAELRQLARETSLDPETRLRAGDLRYFDEDGIARNARDPQVAEELATAAFALEEEGDWAPEPIQVRNRWSILRLTGLRPAEHQTLTQATRVIRGRLWRDRRRVTIEDFVRDLREQAGVEANYELLRAIRLDPPVRADLPGDEHRDEGGGEDEAPSRAADEAPPAIPAN